MRQKYVLLENFCSLINETIVGNEFLFLNVQMEEFFLWATLSARYIKDILHKKESLLNLKIIVTKLFYYNNYRSSRNIYTVYKINTAKYKYTS